jgi:hypothetical protein
VISRALDELLKVLEKRFGRPQPKAPDASLEPVTDAAPLPAVEAAQKPAEAGDGIGPHPSLVRTIAKSQLDADRKNPRRNGSSSTASPRRSHFRQRNGVTSAAGAGT